MYACLWLVTFILEDFENASPRLDPQYLLDKSQLRHIFYCNIKAYQFSVYPENFIVNVFVLENVTVSRQGLSISCETCGQLDYITLEIDKINVFESLVSHLYHRLVKSYALVTFEFVFRLIYKRGCTPPTLFE